MALSPSDVPQQKNTIASSLYGRYGRRASGFILEMGKVVIMIICIGIILETTSILF